MSPDETDEPADETRDEDPQAEAMQRRVDELEEHIDEGVKKAQVTREQARPDADTTLKDDAGDWSGTTSDEDDAAGADDADDADDAADAGDAGDDAEQ
ncbi:MAG TPA: hypothetical protein VGV67_05190 [Solirubrobacteraceae bacterium]|nr:hypothetical protein [Solirubrobacteraceae bacterium]